MKENQVPNNAADAAAPAGAPIHSEPAAACPRRVRLLVVDDSYLVRQRWGELFQSVASVDVVGSAGDGPQGLALFRALQPDAVVLDLHLPGLNGLDLLGLIKQERPDCMVMVCTAYTGNEFHQQCLERGADFFFDKFQAFEEVAVVLRRMADPDQPGPAGRARPALPPHPDLSLLRLQDEALTAAANAIIIAHRDGTIAWANPAFARLSGYAMAEILHQNPRFLKSGRHDAAFYARMWRTILAGEVWRGEVVNRRKDGTLYTEEMSITPVCDAGGAVRHFIAVKQDVTGRQQAERDLRRLNRALRILSEGNRALVRADDEATLLRDICRIIVETGGYPLAWVGYAENDAARRVRPAAHAGPGDGFLDVLDVTWADQEHGRGPTGTAIRTGRPCVVDDFATFPHFPRLRAEAARRGYAAAVGLPLVARGQTLGALTVYADAPGAFAAEEERLLMELAADLAFGVAGLRERLGSPLKTAP